MDLLNQRNAAVEMLMLVHQLMGKELWEQKCAALESAGQSNKDYQRFLALSDYLYPYKDEFQPAVLPTEDGTPS